MANDIKTSDSALSKAMSNPLAQITKKTEVAGAIADNTKEFDPNQVSPQLDKYENNLIRKKKLQS